MRVGVPRDRTRPRKRQANVMRRAKASFGDLLREFRVRAGLSQGDLAEKADVSEAAIGALERGVRKAPHRTTVALLAKALAVSAEESDALELARLAARKPASNAVAHNILPERTSFIGREADVADVGNLLGRARLVTITGSGGIGKTRLALEVGRNVLRNPWSEVWFVDLSPLSDGNSIAARIASSVQPALRECDNIASLASRLEQRQMLLILDNCEHVIDQSAKAADIILARCTHIVVLATSRERLNVAGEFVYRLPALSAERAADLFVQRTEAADQHISFQPAQLPAVHDIVQHLDGIPLAIELIAAQTPLLGLDAVRTRLRQELRLASGRRDLPERQQTVLATVEWSYNLLTTSEQALLTDISIFSGGFTLVAAESVCSGDRPDRCQVLPLLLSLSNKSLINVHITGGGVRYSLLESVRWFGQERLQQAHRYDEVARRHARWLANIAAEVEASGYLPAQRAAELLPEMDNVRAAIAWSLAATTPDDLIYASQILTGLSGLWDRVGRAAEHRRFIETALERIDEDSYSTAVSDLLRIRVERSWQVPGVLELVDRALAASEKSGDQLAPVKARIVAAQTLAFHGMIHKAEPCIAGAFAVLNANGMERSMLHAHVLYARSLIYMQQGRHDDARRDIEAAESIALSHHERAYVACFINLRRTDIEYAAGNKRAALEYSERMMESEFASDAEVAHFALGRITNLRLQLGDVEGAVRSLRPSLDSMRGNDDYTRGELEYAALALTLRKNPIPAARLWGRVRALEELMPFSRSRMRQDAYNMLQSLLHAQLSKDAIGKAARDGALSTGDEAIDDALDALE